MMYYILGFILYAYLYIRFLRPLSLYKRMVITLFYIYVCMVLYVTILPIPFRFILAGNIYYNMTPFIDVSSHHIGAMRQVYLNVLMFMPFGFLYPILTNKTIYTTTFWAFLWSASIEGIQFLYTFLWGGSRVCDITDLITNTIGGVIGYLLYSICHGIMLHKKVKQIQSYDEYI